MVFAGWWVCTVFVLRDCHVKCVISGSVSILLFVLMFFCFFEGWGGIRRVSGLVV